jgi:hypothetical protein
MDACWLFPRLKRMLRCSPGLRVMSGHRRPALRSRQARAKRLTENETFFLSNLLGPKATGLPMVVHVSPKTSTAHGPCIKVSRRYGEEIAMGEWFTVTIDDDPSITGTPGAIRVNDLVLVSDFILLNKDVLLDFWEQTEPMDTPDMLQKLAKV